MTRHCSGVYHSINMLNAISRNFCYLFILIAADATNGNQNIISNVFCSTFVDSINVFDCRLSGVRSLLRKSH